MNRRMEGREGIEGREPFSLASILSITFSILSLFSIPSICFGQSPDTIRLAGLSRPVEILRDRWGISHIYGQTEADLFFAQGYSAARDRLFQFEVWRRQATGTMAELLGRRELARDIGARLFKFRGDLGKELAHYHPRGALIVEAFVRGVNAYIAETERRPELLPLEFRLLGTRPGRWTADVVISRHQGLLRNVSEELTLGRVSAQIGPDRLQDLMGFHPGTPQLTLVAPVDSASLAADLLGPYHAFRAPVRFEPGDVLAAFRAEPTDLALGRPPPPPAPSEAQLWARAGIIGSNNWVVAGSRTASGRPLMANDPHRIIQVPSLRYYVHLVAPGWDVIGGGEPVLPGVSIGHNRFGAWGLTVFSLDSEDLYVYQTNPADPRAYRYRGHWERTRAVLDTVRVKGEPPVPVELRFTRHGPVVYQDTTRHLAYAIRAAWRDVGSAPYLASLRMDQATTWEEFRDACSYSYIPGENMIWADRNGTIGWQAVGVAPIRPNWSGLVPVPGDGRYEWAGYLPVKSLPNVVNPTQGFWATANQDNVPAGYAHRNAVGWGWADDYRYQRIVERLRDSQGLTLEAMTRLQQDELSGAARALVPLLRNIPFEDSLTRTMRDRLLAWDAVLRAESPEAGVYVAWERRLTAGVAQLVLPARVRPLLEDLLPLDRVVDWLVRADAHFGAAAARVKTRDSLVAASFALGVTDLYQRLGPGPESWQYGQPLYKHVLIRHPLSAAVRPDIREQLDVGPLPRGGSGHTLNNTGDGNNQTSGPSLRILADVDGWDRSLGTNTPGQSGNPADPHYRDLFAPWAAGEYFPLAFTRPRVEAVREATTVLLPRDAAAAGP